MSTIYDLSADIRPGWQRNEQFLDYNEVHGLALSRLVRESDSSRFTGIAGKDIRTIRLIDLAFRGADNWYLRAISAGRFVRVEFLRSNKEGHFIHHLLQRLRSQKNPSAPSTSPSEDRDSSIDLDIIGEAVAAKEKMGFNTMEEKKAVYFKLADMCYDTLKKYAPMNDMKKMQEEIKAMQEKLATVTAENTELRKADKLPTKRKRGIDSYFKNPEEPEEEKEDEAAEQPHDIFNEIHRVGRPVSYTHLTLPTIYSV